MASQIGVINARIFANAYRFEQAFKGMMRIFEGWDEKMRAYRLFFGKREYKEYRDKIIRGNWKQRAKHLGV